MRGRLVTVRERASSFVLLFLCALKREGGWPSAAWLAPALPRCGAGTLAASGGRGSSGSAESWAVWEKTGDFVLVPPPPHRPGVLFCFGGGFTFPYSPWEQEQFLYRVKFLA